MNFLRGSPTRYSSTQFIAFKDLAINQPNAMHGCAQGVNAFKGMNAYELFVVSLGIALVTPRVN